MFRQNRSIAASSGDCLPLCPSHPAMMPAAHKQGVSRPVNDSAEVRANRDKQEFACSWLGSTFSLLTFPR